MAIEGRDEFDPLERRAERQQERLQVGALEVPQQRLNRVSGVEISFPVSERLSEQPAAIRRYPVDQEREHRNAGESAGKILLAMFEFVPKFAGVPPRSLEVHFRSARRRPLSVGMNCIAVRDFNGRSTAG